VTVSSSSRNLAIGVAVVAAIAAVSLIPVGERSAGARFFSSLRIAKPKPDTAGAGLATPLNGGRRLQDVLAGVVAESTVATRDEPNEPVATADAAAKTVGFRPRLLAGRSEPPTITVLGEQHVEGTVNSRQLQTLLTQAGNGRTAVPRALDGTRVAFAVGRGVRVQYGNCPAQAANTIQGQINGPPPPSADNASCVAVSEVPIASVSIPAGLDTAAIMELALEVAGMSPNQSHDFRRLFAWPAAAVIAPPRGTRSYEVVRVGDAEAMLVITGGRRGPTYALAWVQGGIVYTLTGYGSSADAVPLAKSLE
jgi:hypothetical protein